MKFFKKCFDYNFSVKLTNIEKNNEQNPKLIEIITEIRTENPKAGGFVWFQKFIDFNKNNYNKFLKLFLPVYKEKLGNAKDVISTYQLDTLKGMGNLRIVVEDSKQQIKTIVNKNLPIGHKMKLLSSLPKTLSFQKCDLCSFPIQVINLYEKLGTFQFANRPQNGLIELCLSKNEIFLIPKEIGLLKNQLKTIDLSDNNLSSIPEEFGDLVKLENLNVAGNKIECLPKTIMKLDNLQQLNVQQNPLNESSKTVIELKKKLGEKMLLPSELINEKK